MKGFFAFLLLLFTSYTATAQSESYTVSGTIRAEDSGETLIGATIHDPINYKGTSTNVYGFYSLSLPAADSVKLVFSFVGHVAQTRTIALNADQQINISLSQANELETIVVTGEESIQERSKMSTFQMDKKMINAMPALLGERDLLKSIQLLPGIQSGSEGGSGLYVRGGGPDQNLMLLDGVPLYNTSHLFGFFSVFNTDALSHVEVSKGGFPARYGGRLSSVIDVRMKEGNMNKLHGEGGIGLISSRLTLEGPINKGKTSFLFSGRRTYIDVLAAPFVAAESEGEDSGGYFFYDSNLKLNHIIDDNNRVFISGYYGNDKAYARTQSDYDGTQEKSEAILAWGNGLISARWNRIINPKLFANTTATLSNYRFVTRLTAESESNGDTEKETYEYRSSIRDYGLKLDLDYLPNPNHTIKTGLGYTYHIFTPGVTQFTGNQENIEIGSDQEFAHEFYAFAEDDWAASKRIKMNIGLRLSGFAVDESFYYGIEPRFSGRYLLNDESSIKVSYAHMVQYLHLLTNGSVGLPTDLWVPVTDRIAPQISDQIALGYAQSLSKDYEISIETYYKLLDNLIEYKDGASFQGTAEDWQDKVAIGDGQAYGAEFLLRKRYGKLNGWIGYTLSWSNRQFDEINFGRQFPYKYDRRHDIGMALNYVFNERVDMGAVWVYGTGNSISLPVAQHASLDNDPVNQNSSGFTSPIDFIDERNGYRMAAYHRLDLGVNFKKQMKKHERIWSFGIYNIYSRQNPFFLYFGRDNSGTRQLRQASLFPIIPSFSYNFKF